MSRKLITVRIDEDLYNLAKELNLNLSFLLELAILRIAKIRGVDVEPYLRRLLNTNNKRKLTYVDVTSSQNILKVM
ncbi:MAG: type II toxin-antitoxin system CcdA family antitoxin [Ignisphaera sp.]